MEKPGASLVEREGLESVIENARKSAEAGYPDNPASDPQRLMPISLSRESERA